MSALVTALLAVVIVAILAFMAVGPIRAVREDRDYALEERGWLATGRFPAEVEREYRQPRLVLTDGTRLRELGYEVGERRTVRGVWGRLQAVTWRATRPPGKPDETTGDAAGSDIARGADTAS
jgi:hypothetical protein